MPFGKCHRLTFFPVIITYYTYSEIHHFFKVRFYSEMPRKHVSPWLLPIFSIRIFRILLWNTLKFARFSITSYADLPISFPTLNQSHLSQQSTQPTESLHIFLQVTFRWHNIHSGGFVPQTVSLRTATHNLTDQCSKRVLPRHFYEPSHQLSPL